MLFANILQESSIKIKTHIALGVLLKHYELKFG